VREVAHEVVEQRLVVVDEAAHGVLARRDLAFVSTLPEEALKNATLAFLKLKRPPKTGLSAEAEAKLIEELNPN
jgi:hypothetical protein